MVDGRGAPASRVAASRRHWRGRLGQQRAAELLPRHEARVPRHQDLDPNGHAVGHCVLRLRDELLPHRRQNPRIQQRQDAPPHHPAVRPGCHHGILERLAR